MALIDCMKYGGFSFFIARTVGCSIQSFFEISGLDATLDWPLSFPSPFSFLLVSGALARENEGLRFLVPPLHWLALMYLWLSCLGSLVVFIRRGKWSLFNFFEVLPANVTGATYQNIRKLFSGVFSNKYTLQFAVAQTFDHAALASWDILTKLLFTGYSSSLCLQSWRTRPIYSLRWMCVDKINRDTKPSISKLRFSDHVSMRWSDSSVCVTM